MTSTTAQLIPAANFEARSLKGQTITFTIPTGQVKHIFKGWGIWDKAAQAWVTLGETCEATGQPLPVCYKRSTAKAAIAQGLYNGYTVCNPTFS